MTHTYNVTGMTCSGCLAKVKHLLSQVDGVQSVDIDLSTGDTSITMNKHIETPTLQNALKDHPKYQLSEKEQAKATIAPIEFEEDQKSWLETYKPILLVFGYITGVTLLVQFSNESFIWMEWMNHFMAGFFLVFSFFKILNLSGFAESYAMYDIIAKRWNGYGYLYAFIELGLGIAYLTGFNPIITNAVTLIVMSLSIIGVLQSVLDNKKIKCACLGAVFNLPMSTITIIEDALMIGMSALMLIKMM
ncbi:MAG: Heavy metal transport/detoxification protein [Bacteroidetes bacterium]|jgi:copper chaperone CopZ|nr:Heavy metal transport/detoxification protein [Bacteroidota bacterium]